MLHEFKMMLHAPDPDVGAEIFTPASRCFIVLHYVVSNVANVYFLCKSSSNSQVTYTI